MFRRLGASIRKWMYGRYGSDQLNMLLLVLAVILSLTNTILTYALRTSTVYRGIIAPILSLLMYGLLILAMVRMFSRNLSRRERENRRFLQLWMRLRDVRADRPGPEAPRQAVHPLPEMRREIHP